MVDPELFWPRWSCEIVGMRSLSLLFELADMGMLSGCCACRCSATWHMSTCT